VAEYAVLVTDYGYCQEEIITHTLTLERSLKPVTVFP